MLKRLLALCGFLFAGAVSAQTWVPITDAWVRVDGGIPISAGYLTIRDESTNLAQEATLNFLGAGIDCVDNVVDLRTECTVAGGAGSASVTGTGPWWSSSGTLQAAAGTFTLPLSFSAGVTSLAITPTNPGGGIALQATTPGTVQTTANLNIDGTAVAGAFELASGAFLKWTALGKITSTVDGRFTCSKATPDNTCVINMGAATSSASQLLGNGTVLSVARGDASAGTFATNGFRLIPVNKTTTYTAAINDSIIRNDATGGAYAVTLPTAAANGQFFPIYKTDTSTNALTVTRGSSNTIAGAISVVMAQPGAVLGIADTGTGLGQWIPIAGNQNVTTGLFTANGARLDEYSVSESVTIAAAATTDSTIDIPAGAYIMAVTVRVTTAIPTATTFQVGDPTTAGRFCGTSGQFGAVAVAINTTAICNSHLDPAVAQAAGPNQVATAKVRFTPSSTPGAATGIVRVTLFVRVPTPPTS